MYCGNCNVEFPEGLRYCKWCGGPLGDQARVTSELLACSVCGAAIQPGWAFCKACGSKVSVAPPEPPKMACPRCGALIELGLRRCPSCGQDLTQELVSGRDELTTRTYSPLHCGSCGEALDFGSAYCKACGEPAAAPSQAPPTFTIVCAACHTHNLLGSATCRICGAALPEMPTVPFDSATPRPPVPVVEAPPSPQAGAPHPKPDDTAKVEVAIEPLDRSEAPTLRTRISDALKAPADQSDVPTLQTPIPDVVVASQQPIEDHSLEPIAPASAEDAGAGVDTSALPGVAGSRAEQQLSTSIIRKARTTSPVDEELSEPEPPAPRPPSGDLFATRTDVPIPSGVQVRGNTGSDLIALTPATERPPEPPGEIAATREVKLGDWAATEQQAVIPETTEFTVPPTGALGPAPRPARTLTIVSLGAAVIVLGVSAYLVWAFVLSKNKPQLGPSPKPPVVQPPVATPAPPIAPPPVTEIPTTPTPPEGMVYVAGGTYFVGRDDRDPLESPRHTALLSAFFIDQTEVTNAAYKMFVDSTGHKAPGGWKNSAPRELTENQPVTGITWQDAADFASWAGKRLPTEAEWEAAARGLDGRNYPWGNEWRKEFANIGTRGIQDVGKYKDGASPCGALDMIGNVWEWTADEFSLYPGSIATVPSLIRPGVTFRVIRGGAYDGVEMHDASYRGFIEADRGWPKTGFRCVKSAK